MRRNVNGYTWFEKRDSARKSPRMLEVGFRRRKNLTFGVEDPRSLRWKTPIELPVAGSSTTACCSSVPAGAAWSRPPVCCNPPFSRCGAGKLRVTFAWPSPERVDVCSGCGPAMPAGTTGSQGKCMRPSRSNIIETPVVYGDALTESIHGLSIMLV